MRDKSWRRFGTTLTGLALGLLLLLSSFGLVMTAAAVEPTNAFGGHALCLADGGNQPADAPAVPAHTHGGFCCLWHQIPGVQPVAATAPIPVAFAYVRPFERGPTAFIPGPRRGSVNARAPPTLT